VRTGAVTITRDISERKRIEAELSEAEERFRTFFEEILYRSHQFELLTGYPNTIWEKDRTFVDAVIHPEDRAWMRAYDARAAETGDPYLAEYRIITRDGRQIWVRDQAQLIRNAEGRWRYWVGMVTDISAQKTAEAATSAALARLETTNRDLAHQNAAKSAFVSTISHEFRTPLTSIEGFSELILTEAASLEEAQGFALIINQNALRLARLVQDVLDLDRMAAGPVPLRLTAIDLNALVTATLDDFRGQSGHLLVTALDETLPVIVGDADRLTQVVTNVLANAIKYAPEGGTITVATHARPGGIALSIADEGLGIPMSDRETIFTPYERIIRPDHPTIEGTGLGLPISRHIVALHGGTIWVEPNTPKGSIFHVWLPSDHPVRLRTAKS
jgi:PAS domain S-box-containing protein